MPTRLHAYTLTHPHSYISIFTDILYTSILKHIYTSTHLHIYRSTRIHGYTPTRLHTYTLKHLYLHTSYTFILIHIYISTHLHITPSHAFFPVFSSKLVTRKGCPADSNLNGHNLNEVHMNMLSTQQ